jgi:xanthine dehydrogenase accessory factor
MTNETVENKPPANAGGTDFVVTNSEFRYTEHLGFANDLYIIGGGHCALALSEIMSKMDFHISLFDDRPELNTIEKNRFAHEITIIDGYDRIGDHVSEGDRSYVVVMTLGYVSDGQAIRSLLDKQFKYFGVLGSNAKMTTMLRELVKEGVPRALLDRIRTPVGIPIHSRTPEEIAVSIAAEIISVKNAE